MVTRIGGRRPAKLFLAQWRQFLGLTQEQVAERVESTKGTISRWETGTRAPPFEALEALADAFGRPSPADLFRDPLQPTADDLLRELRPADRERVISFIDVLRKTGTEG